MGVRCGYIEWSLTYMNIYVCERIATNMCVIYYGCVYWRHCFVYGRAGVAVNVPIMSRLDSGTPVCSRCAEWCWFCYRSLASLHVYHTRVAISIRYFPDNRDTYRTSQLKWYCIIERKHIAMLQYNLILYLFCKNANKHASNINIISLFIAQLVIYFHAIL